MKRAKFINTIFLILISGPVLLTPAVGQLANATTLAIDVLVKRAALRFESSKAGFVLKMKYNNRTVEEKFSYSMTGDDIEVLSVRYRDGNADNEEIYYFQGRQLVYATESQSPVDGASPAWSGIYYFKNGKLLDFVTNGHGKSEDDSWDPEDEVLRMSGKRMKQLRDHLKRGDLR